MPWYDPFLPRTKKRKRGWKADRVFGDIGGAVFGDAGKKIGGIAGNIFRSVTGWGDYDVNSNTLSDAHSVAEFAGSDHLDISGKEFVCQIYSHDGDFELSKSIELNPMNQTDFSKLALYGTGYEKYRWNGLMFYFVSQCVAPTDSLQNIGTVNMMTDYNVHDGPPNDIKDFRNQHFNSSGPPDRDLPHAIECAPGTHPDDIFYCQHRGVKEDEDKSRYILGNFYLCVGSQPTADVVIGELWVTYDVTFYEPVRPNYTIFNGVCQIDSDVQGAAGSQDTLDNYVLNTKNTIDVVVAIDQRIYFLSADRWVKGDNFVIIQVIEGDSTACTAGDVNTANLTALTINSNSSISNTGQTVTKYFHMRHYEITDTILDTSATISNTYLDLGANGTYPANDTSVTTWIFKIPGGMED